MDWLVVLLLVCVCILRERGKAEKHRLVEAWRFPETWKGARETPCIHIFGCGA